MADEGFKRKLAAILSADVDGFRRLMSDDKEDTIPMTESVRKFDNKTSFRYLYNYCFRLIGVPLCWAEADTQFAFFA